MVDANIFINSKFNKATETEITNQKLLDKGLTTTVGTPDGLKGKLELKGFKLLTKLEIDDGKKFTTGLDNDLTELVIINCPNLKEINVKQNKLIKLNITKIKTVGDKDDGEPDLATNLTKLTIGSNPDLEEVSLKYCPKLKVFLAPGCNKLKKIEKIDHLNEIEQVNVSGGLMKFIVPEKLTYFREVVKYVRETLGISEENPLPLKTDGSLDKNKLKTQLEQAVAGVTTAAKAQAQQEAQEAKDKLTGIETERDQLKQQLENIRKELGLGQNATEQQFIDKIKELKRRPTGPVCTHTDYDTIKSERDSLKIELDAKKSRISELELEKNSNKENKDDKAITRKALVDSTNTNLASWGVNISSEQREKMQDAISAEKVEEVRNQIIKTELDKLKQENKSSFYLNLGLGALTIGSLILLIWIMMRETNLPKMELEKKDQK